MIDAAGAIYVIGGDSNYSFFCKDVWVSTDGGADRTRSGMVGWGTRWVVREYNGGTTGYSEVLAGLTG